MDRLMLKEIPRYEHLLEASRAVPSLDPQATEAYLHLIRVGDELLALAQDQLSEHRLSKGGFMVLLFLLDPVTLNREILTPTVLADRTNVTRATMTGLLDTLEKEGLVCRRPDAENRRQICVELTDAGEERLHEAMPTHFRHISDLMNGLTEGEQKMLVTLVNKVGERAAKVAGERVARA